MVLSGAPVEIPNHAELITDYGFSIIDAVGKVRDPSTQDPLSIRVGMYNRGTSPIRVSMYNRGTSPY